MYGKKILIVVILLAGLAGFFYFDLASYFSLQSLQENRTALRNFTAENYVLAVGIFVAVYILQTVFSLPGAAIMTLAGGFLFGPVRGTMFVAVGATIGATIAFLAARYVLRDWVEKKFGKTIAPLQRGFAKNDVSYLLTLRLVPLFPFFIVNLVSGLTRMKIRTYIIATAAGIIPGSFVFAFAGQQLGNINSLGEIVSPPVLTAFVLLGLLALTPIAYQQFTAYKKSRMR